MIKKWDEESFLNNAVWYHATTPINAKNIVYKGIISSINSNRSLDFGYGFYLCPEFEWARQYILRQIQTTDSDEQVDDNEGYVLEFHFVPKEYCSNKKRQWKFYDGLNFKFAKFVFRNRMYYKYHFFTHCVHNYAMVGGPMSDGNQINDFREYKQHKISRKELYKRLLAPKENWQLLLHSQTLCDSIRLVKVYNLKGVEIDVKSL